MKRIIAALVAVAGLTAGLVGATAPANAGGPPASYNDIFQSIPLTVNGDYEPVLFGCTGEDPEDAPAYVLWYAAGPTTDYLWTITGIDPLEYTSEVESVNGEYTPLTGDFDGDGCDDVFWYAPGSTADYVWWGDKVGEFVSQKVKVDGDYRPVVGMFGGDTADIFWYAPGSGTEYVWRGNDDRTFTSTMASPVNGDYRVAASGSAILFHKPGAGTDFLWTGLDDTDGTFENDLATTINGTYEPSAGAEGFLLYAAGSNPDFLLYDIQEDGTPMTIPATINGTYEIGVKSPMAGFAHLWHAPGSAPDFLWIPDFMEAEPLGGAAAAGTFGSSR